MKFKVGDKVKLSGMFVGFGETKEGVIIKIDNAYRFGIEVQFENGVMHHCENDLELVERKDEKSMKFEKGDIVRSTRYGWKGEVLDVLISPCRCDTYVQPYGMRADYYDRRDLELVERKGDKIMMNKMNAKETRMEMLNKAGQDTTQYIGNTGFTLEELHKMIANGADITVNGVQINIGSKVAKQIEDDGYVYNAKLDGRWIAAQMFKMMKYVKRSPWGNYCYSSRDDGYTDYLNNEIDYGYQFKFLVDELGRIAKREEENDVTIGTKLMFFNPAVVASVCRAYIVKLQNHINAKIAKEGGRHKFNGKEYVRISTRLPKAWKHITESDKFDVYIDKLDRMYKVLEDICEQIEASEDMRECQELLKEFIRKMPVRFHGKGQLHAEFVEAYKGNGAYYTLMNLLREGKKGCYVWNHDKSSWGYRKTEHNGTHLTREEGIELVNQKAWECYDEGCFWKLLGFMREVIRDNNFDLETYLGK